MGTIVRLNMVNLLQGNCKKRLSELDECSIDSCVTDPPYELGFMGKKWDDSGIAFDQEMWEEVYRVLKPGSFLLAFSGTRTHHRMMVAIEDAGFQILDTLMWVYGTGFPKAHDISKGVDKELGMEDERKVVDEKEWDVGGGNALNLREGEEETRTQVISEPASEEAKKWEGWATALKPAYEPISLCFKPPVEDQNVSKNTMISVNGESEEEIYRFFYCPKAHKSERNLGCEDNNHPTVKPIELMSYLIRISTPRGGKTLDPFVGSGTAAISALLEGRDAVGIDLDEENIQLSQKRVDYVRKNFRNVYDWMYDDPSNKVTEEHVSTIEHNFW